MNFKTLLIGAIATSAFASTAIADGHEGERARDGEVKIIYWQAPSILNPYLSGGTKDIESSSLVIEPMGRYDQNGDMMPWLAAEIPTVGNGGVSKDLTSITWKLKEGLVWSDGSPVTSTDVVFTANYCMDPDGGCAQLEKFDGVVSVEAIDTLTTKVTFKEAKPNPYGPFMGGQSPIIQAAQFADCTGARAPECTAENFGPIGTGPFVVTNFKPNDVIQMVANDKFRTAGKPAFASLTFKGGGSAEASGRAVMETGEYDYGWNLQLAPDVIAKMKEGGKGTPISAFGALVERLEMNLTNPSPDLPPETRSTVAEPHPFLSEKAVRQALSMAINRQELVDIGYGDAGRPTCNLVPAPALYASDNTGCLTQDIAGANAMLEAAGWVKGSDGVRAKNGVRLSILYQTSTNAVRQDFQALIKDSWNQIGVETELRNLDASVFFGGDPGSPDTYQKFYADVEMYANVFDGTDPQAYLAAYRCGNEPKPSSQWQGPNINRFCDPAYDAMIDELARTGDLARRGELGKKMNDMLTKDSFTIVPLVDRGRVSAHANSLGGVILNTFDSELWNVADWYRKGN
ncbi:MAG: peptide ABC transporter substrate-binding protein [Planktomarina sp.]|jgi:peptide/nickel transport system substrate-binding protein|nr:peptide ABC transporter substrate-binding protein [Planktomarina sp.]MDT2018783.1 peptide ABC transporter substrate-binding protein [Planktomarina sp.]MDV3050482.1 peptide ABC transporter substrate-binding protein [Planktomarina sp.]|tara:strand:- start:2474 stop:4192 length:1719 start_codon:yes stop_codon:yes gene_type:complete